MTNSTPGTSLATRPKHAASLAPLMTDDEIERTWRIATALAKSRVFKDVTQAEQAFAKILLGRDLGLSPAQSMNAMDFVKGNVMLRSVTLASFVKKSPDYDYHVDEHDETKCVITFYSLWPDGQRVAEGVSSFTIEDARNAKLLRADSAWTAHPRNMLFARAMSNGVKWYAPDMMGGIPVYTEGDSFEIEDAVVIGTTEEEPTASAVVLPPAAERVLVRAKKLGHDGLSDRATAEMTLGGQTEEFVREWVMAAQEELDAMERPEAATPAGSGERGPDAPAHDDPEPPSHQDPGHPLPESPPADALELRRLANDMLEEVIVLRESGEKADSNRADELEEEAAHLMAQAEALGTDQDGPVLF